MTAKFQIFIKGELLDQAPAVGEVEGRIENADKASLDRTRLPLVSVDVSAAVLYILTDAVNGKEQARESRTADGGVNALDGWDVYRVLK